MMLCKSEFDELFPDIFSPTKVDPAHCGEDVGQSDGALSARQEAVPLRFRTIVPPPHLATAPIQGGSILKEPACPPDRRHA